MTIIVTAVYPASDGRVPESMEVRWEDGVPGAADLLNVIDALSRVPRERDHE